MKKLTQILMVVVLMLTAVLFAVVGLKAYKSFEEEKQLARQQEEQRIEEVFARNGEAQDRVKEMQKEIEQLTNDKEKLEQFIQSVEEAKTTNETQGTTASFQISGDTSVSGDISVSGDAGVSGNFSVSGNSVSGNSVSGNSVSGNSVSGNFSVSGNSVSDNSVSGNSVSGNFSVSENSWISGNGILNFYDGTHTGNSIFDEWRTIYVQPEMTLEQRREIKTSLEETLEVNQSDREFIAENRTDFSNVKITCLGDSITEAANLDQEENYKQYSYPARLQELLQAKEVVNLGIGGSSIGRYWADAFVDRYTEIPEDTDIIIVMGGTNDGFCVSADEFGNLRERSYRTFCGDLNELMSGLRENYPNADIFFATPLPNILHDYLMSERDYLIPQKDFVEVIMTLANEYGIHLIDLYNSNILDSHDANVLAEYVVDGVHCSHEGYQILAEHFAAELVRYYDGKPVHGDTDADTSEAENIKDDNANSSDLGSENVSSENTDSHDSDDAKVMDAKDDEEDESGAEQEDTEKDKKHILFWKKE